MNLLRLYRMFRPHTALFWTIWPSCGPAYPDSLGTSGFFPSAASTQGTMLTPFSGTCGRSTLKSAPYT